MAKATHCTPAEVDTMGLRILCSMLPNVALEPTPISTFSPATSCMWVAAIFSSSTKERGPKIPIPLRMGKISLDLGSESSIPSVHPDPGSEAQPIFTISNSFRASLIDVPLGTEARIPCPRSDNSFGEPPTPSAASRHARMRAMFVFRIHPCPRLHHL